LWLARAEIRVIARSDTVIHAAPAVGEEMGHAALGDDVVGECPTVNALQEDAASRCGKEAALWVPSGTMANQISLLVYCRPGDHVIVPRGSHVCHYEAGGAGAIAGVQLSELGDQGRYDLDELEASVAPDDHLHAPTQLVTIENTHNRMGGRVVDLEAVSALAVTCRRLGLPLHLDGARLFNALVALDVTPQQMGACVDSLSICLSKGLGAPVGSVLMGSTRFIERAHRYRKMLGGGLRQAGVVAAAGRFALDHNIDRLVDDHRRARRLAQGLAVIPGVHVDPGTVETNIVIFELDPNASMDAHEFAARASEHGVHGFAIAPRRLRWVTHLHIDDADVEHALSIAALLLAG